MDSDLEKLKSGILNRGLFFGEVPDGTFIWDLRECLMFEDYGYLASRLLWEKIKKYDPEVLYGPGTGALPLLTHIQAIALSENKKLSILSVRDSRKEHNRKRLVEGPRPRHGARAVYIDDLFNGGTTWNKAPQKLLEENIYLDTKAIAVVVDGQRLGTTTGGVRRAEARGTPVESLFKRGDFGLTRMDGKKHVVKKQCWRLLSRNEGDQGRLKNPPKIYKDKVFHITDQGILYCLDLETGDINWMFSPILPYHGHAEVINMLQVVEDKLYYTSYDGTCRCFDTITGEMIWQIMTASYQHSSPEIDLVKRRFYLNAELLCTTQQGKIANQQSDISCYDLDSGRLIWRSEPVAATGPGAVFIAGDKLITSSNNKSLRCHDAATGKLIWTVPFTGDCKGRSAILNGRVFAVAENGDFKIIDIDTAQVIHHSLVGRRSRHQYLTSVPDLGIVLVMAEQNILAIDENGNKKWAVTGRGQLQTAGVLQGYHFLVVSNTGYAMIIDIRDGSKIASSMLDTGPVHAPPSWQDNKLAVHSLRRGLYLFETRIPQTS